MWGNSPGVLGEAFPSNSAGEGAIGDTGEDSQGSSPRLPGETVKGEWGWGGNKCDPPAGDGDHTLDWERNGTLGL